MKKILALLLCLCTVFVIAACGEDDTQSSDSAPTNVTYKLGMGVVVDMDSSATNNAQVDATVATVVVDANGKIVACRIDVAQNKMDVTDGAVDTEKTFLSKAELGDDYGMGGKPYSPDNNGDGKVLEWYQQAQAFEAWTVGKTAAEIAAMPTQTLENDQSTNGYVITADEALLAAGCTIQVGDFVDAVVKACNDEQSTTFTMAQGAAFTLGVAVKSTAAESTAATADTDGSVKMYSDFAAAVVADGKIVAALNDAIQPSIAINTAGEIGTKSFQDTKRCLKENYGMGGKPYSPDNDGDGRVLEWYVQSAAFSAHVVGMTGSEVAAMPTQEANGHLISTDEALLAAGCTIQITGICAVMAQAVTNAR